MSATAASLPAPEDRVESSDAVLDMIRSRYPTRRFAVFPEVRNAGGFDATRSCDAMVVSLWPSDGHDIHGIEIKVSRSDWLRELKQPEKADAMMAVCDFWWVAIGDRAIAKAEEVPAQWGLLAPRGGSLVVVKQAPRLTAIPMDRGTLASLCKRAQEDAPRQSELAEAAEHAAKQAREGERLRISHERKDWQELRAAVDAFELASGVEITSYNGKRIGEAVRTVMEGREASYAARLRYIGEQAQHLSDAVKQALAAPTTQPGGAV